MVVSMYDAEQIEYFTKLFDEVKLINLDTPYETDGMEGRGLWTHVDKQSRSVGFHQEVKAGKQCFYTYSLQMDWNGDILSCCHT